MLQFSSQQMVAIKNKATQSMIDALKNDNEVVLNNPVLVPEDGRATWNLYYFCPEHGVRLTWDRDKPLSHICPVDGKEFTGEPYDGAWWRWLNGLNAKACYDLGLLWQITEEPIYLEKVREILLAYATYYPDYEVHGGIPYNGPGKANAQTLCEANCHIDLARGYDFIKQALTEQEQDKIEKRLLREGAEFLMEHRSAQLHNHEMKINATIGVIGLILDDHRYIDFALNTDYGIHYQLNHGCLGEGMWFEGSVHYHYYALQALLNFEKIAHSTPYSVSSNPNYLKMMKFPLKLVMNNGDFPRLNDSIAGQEKLTHAHLFEFAYKQTPCEEFAQVLTSIYQNISRDNIDALLYGVDELPNAEPIKCQSMHAEQAGLTICYDEARNNSMLLKHAPYGGEHDHYDRLGLILNRNGKEILPDLGTTGYGAELHYGYYKNTATHNTLVVNQQNQSPINPTLLNYQQNDKYTLVASEANWANEPAEVDSHTLVQWDEEAYRDVCFRRAILWLGDAAVELNTVINPHQQQLDLTYHVRGTHLANEQRKSIVNPLSGALERMRDVQLIESQTEFTQGYAIEGQPEFNQHFAADREVDVITGYAPDNPATSEIAYSLVRSNQPELKTVLLHDLSEKQAYQLEKVIWNDAQVEFSLTHSNLTRRFQYNLANNQISELAK
ncbi:heparinase II/III family protein [Photobacterium sp. ZSDE20]|uniref:Heparinase II/III family protein n=1 Tax=Photobacterium pectinilyticum TaxID=2906793 RepID=A0ABT1N8N0_9GAMM|nr:heparinase II/III family protein [Photobacterium sp. ZSDE20]MCQ1061093.1 heparinase II/III family protein [Photobacterium sp. ZSDE20]MDD1829211.1 heparinase II/III family protein [Photobacterium sp. ZSDE20]